jgi:hypothetical protein
MIANRIQTPDGTILWSRFGHDYVEYQDANGEFYVLDGGSEDITYRTSVNDEKAKPMQVYSDAPFEEIRKVMLRGTFDEDGKRIWVPLYKLNNSHLQSILDYNKDLKIISRYDKFIEMEIEYRESNCIFIPNNEYTQEDGIDNIIPSK